jgi:hypothetical protein
MSPSRYRKSKTAIAKELSHTIGGRPRLEIASTFRSFRDNAAVFGFHARHVAQNDAELFSPCGRSQKTRSD